MAEKKFWEGAAGFDTLFRIGRDAEAALGAELKALKPIFESAEKLRNQMEPFERLQQTIDRITGPLAAVQSRLPFVDLVELDQRKLLTEDYERMSALLRRPIAADVVLPRPLPEPPAPDPSFNLGTVRNFIRQEARTLANSRPDLMSTADDIQRLAAQAVENVLAQYSGPARKTLEDERDALVATAAFALTPTDKRRPS